MTRKRLDAADAAREVLAATAGRRTAAVATLVAPPSRAGLRMIAITGDDHVAFHGTLGDDALDRTVSLHLRDALDDPGRAGLLQVGEEPDAVEVFIEVHRPRPELLIVGAGHIAQPLAAVGVLLDFDVVVLDDRPDFATGERFPEAARVGTVDFSDPFRDHRPGPWTHAVLVTRGHRYDYECLRRLLRLDPPPAYVGMIGSRRRVRATFLRLREEGVDPERIQAVHAPVGLDIGAETPAEIAVAVAAELVHVRRGGSAQPLRTTERVASRFFSTTREGDDP